ncbi:hypothetical protein HYPSUDRAFT_34300 [Hypholoma sublateritium FD-334 SS-4]|uniref:Peptidase M20 dimerisation domain-containing protein n=1 Tax=Hypholoma sublateritium (strain FD-334 SS-4) TaxID=945553 RepID=A0A0D2Q8J1_HYPSF|nr:hypothetical protein HYPSUDRAFT_34300 [Hypholoma sublateritium FD-334 SS-4]
MDTPTLNIQPGCFGGFFARRTQKKAPTHASALQESSQGLSHEGCLEITHTAEKKEDRYYSAFHDFSYGKQDDWWIVGHHEQLPPYLPKADVAARSGDISSLIEQSLDKINGKLRELSLKIHDHPETNFEEKFAHDLLTNFMEKQGFAVTRHYLGLDTAWRAEYAQGQGGRVVGINSEMDALPGLGHACGHNLIAIAGVGVAVALKTALEARRDVAGKIVLLGTPAEEGGGGKIILLERGAYKEMDVCMMCHPAAGAVHSTSIASTTSMQTIYAEYSGQSAHAGQAPWEGTNALDAAVLAYSSISMLRQQIKPDHRVHGIIAGNNWLANVIPDNSKMKWIARAPTSLEVSVLADRLINCMKAAAIATGCEIEVKLGPAYFDLRQNSVLAQDFTDIVGSRYGLPTLSGEHSASTDFGNVSYALPALHPSFAIPTVLNGGNHTPGFTKAARSEEAHKATILVAKGLALTAFRVLTDAEFLSKVQASFEQCTPGQLTD